MTDPSRNSAMIPSVKRIFLRRSGVRNARANAVSTRSSWKGTRSLDERGRAGRGTAAPGGRHHPRGRAPRTITLAPPPNPADDRDGRAALQLGDRAARGGDLVLG